MKELFSVLGLIWRTIWLGIDKFTPLTSARRASYLPGLRNLATLAFLPPILLATIGVVAGWYGLTAWAGVWCTVFLTALMVWGTPIGVVAEAILNWKWLSIDRFVVLARIALMWEVYTFVALSVTPLRNNWTVAAILIMLVVGVTLMTFHLGMAGAWLKKTILYTSWVGIGIALWILFYPLTEPWLLWLWSPFSKMGFKSAWGIHRSIVWNEWNVIGALAVLVATLWVLAVLYRLGRAAVYSALRGRASTAAGHTPSTGHTPSASSGHSGGGSLGRVVQILGLMALIALFAGGAVAFQQQNRRDTGRGHFARNEERTLRPGQEESVYIEAGWHFDIEPVSPHDRIWVKPQGMPPFLEGRGSTNYVQIVGPTTIWLSTAEDYSVVAKVKLRPN